ncbi:Vacuolar integral membrane protein [Wickerhamomyces ciferrii]|uniref:Vacuolar integral membrane protein n=1 Tax=Wickerhamomyces ciferrii (strain ATCC 14091 / BCRC 22168 / CBS 111 / JCM 3599 / NBRC 0793 / NRRL Y-1031 F-60-10) TaxID=1206466 RepID=K0KT24_WICCF|nr:Vacuolar integral membrane protein [Wickerhamomyces ciferrii]CCH46286.1 Vacuolar integral membrane protein [Wickerhamomyces ciferrii]
MSGQLCDPKSLTSVLSALSGGASFAASLVASFPQVIETYQQKSVEGISVLFIGIWVVGDLTSLVGCYLTKQLLFQYVLALYYVLCDFVLCGQYYYYGYYLKKHPHLHPHYRRQHSHSHQGGEHNHNTDEHDVNINYGSHNKRQNSKSSLGKAAIGAAVIASNVGQGHALPIGINNVLPSQIGGYEIDPKTYGIIFAWIGAGLYFFARVPQLIKNYQRKSTEDLSPVLFACTLFGNITYTASILLSCEFVYDVDHRWEFFINELPYIIGSAGTIVFDLTYFYQVWLYKGQNKKKNSETQPLLASN